MATQPIDYAAIAKQYGATSSTPPPAKPQNKIDYAAIAKQFGATSSEPPPTQLITDTAQSGPLDTIKQYAGQAVDAVGSAVKEMGKGALKSAAQPAAELSGVINKIPIVGEKLAPRVGVTAFKKATTVENIPQKIGAGIEQAAEMAATGGPLKAGAEQLAARAPSFIEMLMRPAARVGAEAVNVGANAGAHGEPVAPAAAIGGAGAVASEVLPLMAPVLKKAALGQYDRALSASTKPTKTLAKKIEPAMIQRGIRGSLDSIDSQAGQQAAAVKPDLDAAYSALPWQNTQGSGWQVLQDLQGLKGKYMVNGKIANPQAVSAINGVQDVVQQYGSDINPTSLRKLKEIFADPVAAKSGYAGADLTTQYAVKAQKAAADSIRNILHSASPDIAALDKEITFWLNVQKVASSTSLRRTGQEGGLLKVFAPFMAVAGGAAGLPHSPEASLIGATSAFLAAHAATVVRTPAWRTASAVVKDRFANAMAAGDVGKVVALSARFVAGMTGQTQRSAQMDRSQQTQ